MVFQAIAALIFTGIALWSLSLALDTHFGPQFLLYLVPALLCALMVPLLAYRFYALWRAYYIIGRDGLYLHWGLRAETIPIDQVRWVRRSGERPLHEPEPAGEGERERKAQRGVRAAALPLPWLRWPGGVLGVRKLPEGAFAEAVQVEYLADRTRDLILIAAGKMVFAISPADMAGFLDAYRQCSELGSTSPLPAHSEHPTFLIARVWGNLAARYLILAGLILNLALLALVTVAIPARSEIILGFLETSEPVPAIRLMLLPLLSVVFYLMDFFLGLFFFRYDARDLEQRQGEGEAPVLNGGVVRGLGPNGAILAYLLWGSGVLTSFLFIAAVGFILF